MIETSRAGVHAVRLLASVALWLFAGAAVAADEPPPADAPAATFEIESDPLFDSELDDEFDEEFANDLPGFPDPFEQTNRGVFTFNGYVDRWFLDPLTRAYGWIFPEAVKRCIRNAFVNLGEPATVFNDLLQLEWKDASVAGGRFVVNSTLGLAGLFDPAEHVGLTYHRSDFGQTLTLAGTPSGPYLMIPVFGPNDTRDGFGALADTTMHPLTWFLGPANFLIYGIYTSGEGISRREEHVEELTALREGSVDYYAALRNAYYQNRIADIWSRREHRRHDWTEPPE